MAVVEFPSHDQSGCRSPQPGGLLAGHVLGPFLLTRPFSASQIAPRETVVRRPVEQTLFYHCHGQRERRKKLFWREIILVQYSKIKMIANITILNDFTAVYLKMALQG